MVEIYIYQFLDEIEGGYNEVIVKTMDKRKTNMTIIAAIILHSFFSISFYKSLMHI